MKRIYSFLLVALMAASFSLQARDWTVKTATELQTAWAGASTGDAILLAPGTYSMGTNLKFPIGQENGTARRFTVKSQYEHPDSMAILICDIGQPTNPSDAPGSVYTPGGIYSGGLIFENIDLRQRSGAQGSSGHIIYLNMFDGVLNIDSLVFRNCHINQSPRGLVRTVTPRIPNPEYVDAVTTPDVSTEIPKYSSSGELTYFEMTDCLVHDIFVTSGNTWPLVYLSHLPVEMNIERNTFYNMPHMKHFFTMAYAETGSGQAATVTLRNNTFMNTFGADAYIALGAYLGIGATYIFENNIFALPDWIDALNLDPAMLNPDTTSNDYGKPFYRIPYILRCEGGLIYAKNNLFVGPRTIEEGNNPGADGDKGFIVCETENNYTMESLGASWDDFADRQRSDFSFLSSSKFATAGISSGPIGDPRWYKNFANPVTLTVTADNENATVTPRRAYYNSGDQAKVTASFVDGANFSAWKQGSATLSTDNPYTFNITANTDLVASYAKALNKDVNIDISGSTLATATIAPVKETYFIGDEITITVNPHIDEFLGWSDGSMDLVRRITIGDDHINLTAKFKENSYILAWDIDQMVPRDTREVQADHYKDEANKGILGYVVADTAAYLATRDNKYNGATAPKVEVHNCIVRRTDDLTKPSYLYVKFSTKGLSHLNVNSMISSDNAVYKIQKMQYSLDGQNWTDFAQMEVPQAAAEWDEVWLKDFKGTLPAEADDKETVYVRWIADNTTDRWTTPRAETPPTGEFIFLAKVIISAGMGDGDATWRVDPFQTYTAGQKIERAGITLTLGNVSNDPTDLNLFRVVDEETTDDNGNLIIGEIPLLENVEYVAAILANSNPKSATGGNYTANDKNSLPTYGTFWKFEPTVYGTLTMAVWINAAKPSFITENGMIVGEYNAFTVDQASANVYTIDVKAGSEYHIFSSGSKMGIFGFVFEGKSSVDETLVNNNIYVKDGILYINAENDSVAEIYTLLGQKVTQQNLSAGVNEFAGLQAGLYIVKIGSEVQKIILK